MDAHARLKNGFTQDEKCHISRDGSFSQCHLSWPMIGKNFNCPLIWKFYFSNTLFLTYELTHGIKALIALRKLNLQMCMLSHPMGLHVWFLVGSFNYFHTSCVRTAKALVRLCAYAGLPESSLVAYAVSIIISWSGSYVKLQKKELKNV